MVRKLIRTIMENDNAQVALAIGTAGLAFVIGHLWLANEMPKREYAIMSLLVAIVSVSISTGVGGADGLVNRQAIRPDRALLYRVLSTGSVAAAIATTAAFLVYDLKSVDLVILLFAAVISGTVTWFLGAAFQAKQAFRWSLFVFHGPNFLLLLAAAVVQFSGTTSIAIPFAVIPLGYIVFAIVGWKKLVVLFPEGASIRSFGWREPLAYLAIIAVAEILYQLERLLVPGLLTLEDLATFSVLAAVTGPPFRLMQMSFGYTLLPKLRNATSAEARRRLISADLVLATLAIIVTSGLIWIAVPYVMSIFLNDKYELSGPLILAAIVGGSIKIYDRIVRAVITATLPSERLEKLGSLSWISVAVACVVSLPASYYGLVGVIYAVNIGWLAVMLLGLIQIGLARGAALAEKA